MDRPKRSKRPSRRLLESIEDEIHVQRQGSAIARRGKSPIKKRVKVEEQMSSGKDAKTSSSDFVDKSKVSFSTGVVNGIGTQV
ncbi:hypothetical protein PFISCL1PPCAC_23338, partial [Pristionchus fissidentatus]